MLRRFFACLALLTGLIAVGTPANASISDILNCEIGVAADAENDDVEDRRPCPAEEAGNRAEDPGKDDKPAKRAKRVVRPPVLYGVDRALE
ncbi:MAG: hypothetical protein ACO25F_01330 [Erythrobacter sp.]